MIRYHRGQTTTYLVKVGDLEIVRASMSTPKHRSLHTPSPPLKNSPTHQYVCTNMGIIGVSRVILYLGGSCTIISLVCIPYFCIICNYVTSYSLLEDCLQHTYAWGCLSNISMLYVFLKSYDPINAVR